MGERLGEQGETNMSESNSVVGWVAEHWRICTIGFTIGVLACVLATQLQASQQTVGYLTLIIGGGFGLVMLYRNVFAPIMEATDTE